MRAVLLICGPIASGKSTLARAAAHELERRGVSTAVVDLDLVYEMLAHPRARKDQPPIWSRARRASGRLAAAFLDDGADVVIVEGDLLAGAARAELRAGLPAGVPVRCVRLTVSLTEALARVEQDPTRGLSRDPAFLAAHHRQLDAAGVCTWTSARVALARPETDLCLDTGALTAGEAADAVVDWLLRRSEPPASLRG